MISCIACVAIYIQGPWQHCQSTIPDHPHVFCIPNVTIIMTLKPLSNLGHHAMLLCMHCDLYTWTLTTFTIRCPSPRACIHSQYACQCADWSNFAQPHETDVTMKTPNNTISGIAINMVRALYVVCQGCYNYHKAIIMEYTNVFGF